MAIERYTVKHLSMLGLWQVYNWSIPVACYGDPREATDHVLRLRQEDKAYTEQARRNREEDGDDLRPIPRRIKDAMVMRRKLNKE